MRKVLVLSVLFFFSLLPLISQEKNPVKLGVIGLSHDHANWIFRRENPEDVEIVGFVEKNRTLANRYAEKYGFSMEMVFSSIPEMLRKVEVQGVMAFGPIDEHLEIVRICAPLGIHVMVEKPLAINGQQANEMVELSKKHNIHVITNYETTWYSTNHSAVEILKRGDIGQIRKVVVNDGHRGPIEIGVSNEFMDWLGDPDKNGGGAITDFGCYGANLIIWLSGGQKPTFISAITNTYKPSLYPKVDDDAIIILQYPAFQGVIQASWNWPFSRKDMEIYGAKGQLIVENKNKLHVQVRPDRTATTHELTKRPYPENDPFVHFAAIITEEVVLPAFHPSSLENNLLVVEILDAAKKSAHSGERVKLEEID